jgi:hypothetical protein
MKKIFIIFVLFLSSCGSKQYRYRIDCSDGSSYLLDSFSVSKDTVRYQNSDGRTWIVGREDDCYIDTLY